jgi:hypothetical protein
MRWIFTGTFKGRLKQRGTAFYSHFSLFVHNLNILNVHCSFQFYFPVGEQYHVSVKIGTKEGYLFRMQIGAETPFVNF